MAKLGNILNMVNQLATAKNISKVKTMVGKLGKKEEAAPQSEIIPTPAPVQAPASAPQPVSGGAFDYPGAARDSFGRALIPFGNYVQAVGGAPEPIMWLVLNPNTYQRDGGLVLLSEKILDCVRFHNDRESVKTWPRVDSQYWWNRTMEKGWRIPPDTNEYFKRSDIGKWLNGSSWAFDDISTYPKKHRKDFFYDTAFTPDEQARLIDRGFGKVFLLSLEEMYVYTDVLGEVKTGLSLDYQARRRAVATDFAKNSKNKPINGCELIADRSNMTGQPRDIEQFAYLPDGNKQNPCSLWWLRSQAENTAYIVCIFVYGNIGTNGIEPNRSYGCGGVRPAIFLKP